LSIREVKAVLIEEANGADAILPEAEQRWTPGSTRAHHERKPMKSICHKRDP
jgi:hypothetical protein